MGGIDVSRDGGANQETVIVLFVEITSNNCGGDNIPVWEKEMCVYMLCAVEMILQST